jgi:ubiquinol oxidase
LSYLSILLGVLLLVPSTVSGFTSTASFGLSSLSSSVTTHVRPSSHTQLSVLSEPKSPPQQDTITESVVTDPLQQQQQQQNTDATEFDQSEECVIELPVTPSTKFGRPVDEETKRKNKELIIFTKKLVFDTLFGEQTIERAYARFYALETIARMPYFSYLSVLHLFETLGAWRKANYLKVHFAESWNELHHLLIMEELGGNAKWKDRFVAQHVALGYYWMVVGLYLFNPTMAYNFNEAVEEEAFQTYSQFLKEHGDYLKEQPPAQVAVDYYMNEDMYLFDAMHFDGSYEDNESAPTQRRPDIKNLFDVFSSVRDDEEQHVKTMKHMQTDVVVCGPD